MKYTHLSFSQKRLIELGLDAIDAAILRWIVDFWPAMEKTNHDNQEYGWINYGYFTDQMPLLGIKTSDGLRKRLNKMVKAGVLVKHNVKKLAKTKVYIAFGDRYAELISHPDGCRGVHPDESSAVHPDDCRAYSSINNDSSINDSIQGDIATANHAREVIDCFNLSAKQVGWPVARYADNRIQTIRSRIKKNPKWEYDFYKAVMLAEKSQFLTETWKKFNIDWLLKPANMTKVLEGNYNND